MKIPEFQNKKDLYNYLVENKSLLIAEKKAATKHADGFTFNTSNLLLTTKAIETRQDNENSIYRKVVINTTNFMDSHLDVHVPGLWTKSLSENKKIFFLQEHRMQFDKVISNPDKLNAYTQLFNWSDLGYNEVGVTEALVFDVEIEKAKNDFMYNLYKRNEVDNHSVGMQYVKLVMAINDPDYGAEFEAWEKYYPLIINKADADKRGYFWAVTEAKIIEGSAVLIGSNPITPTLNNNKSINLDTLVERIKIYEPSFSLENLNDNKPSEKTKEVEKDNLTEFYKLLKIN